MEIKVSGGQSNPDVYLRVDTLATVNDEGEKLGVAPIGGKFVKKLPQGNYVVRLFCVCGGGGYTGKVAIKRDETTSIEATPRCDKCQKIPLFPFGY